MSIITMGYGDPESLFIITLGYGGILEQIVDEAVEKVLPRRNKRGKSGKRYEDEKLIIEVYIDKLDDWFVPIKKRIERDLAAKLEAKVVSDIEITGEKNVLSVKVKLKDKE